MKKITTFFVLFTLLLVNTACTTRDIAPNDSSIPSVQNDNDNKTESNFSTPTPVASEPIQSIAPDTYSYKEDRRLYLKAKKLYLSGKWDGSPRLFGKRMVEMDKTEGYLIIDGYLVYRYKEKLDMPKDFDYETLSSNPEYIPYHGMYAIKDKMLVKYVRGKEFPLGSSPLYGKELDWQHFQPLLYYVDVAEQLLLVTTNPVSEKKYLYFFPDYDTSKVQYLEEITDFTISWNGERDIFYYRDVTRVSWEYTENGPQVSKVTIFDDF